jgi:two-component system cell cycle sensor histidine kinase PleC
LARQLSEEKLKAETASRSKTSFLAHLSHDVRTPLNHIIGFADLIAHQTYGAIGDKRYLNYINDIKSSGEKLLASFSEILELAQLEGGQLVLRRETIQLTDIVKAISTRYQANADRAGILLEVAEIDDSLFFADRICIERMLGNIIENAIRFTPKGGRVKLATWLADDGIVLEISDTGIGMSPERLEDLSQPFVLGDAAFTREGGVGLGIAISRAIAELSGGDLAIDSSPAVGTTVAISLPSQVTQGQTTPGQATSGSASEAA